MSTRDTWSGRFNPDHLEGWLTRATLNQIHNGSTWYQRQTQELADMAPGMPLERTIAIAATLSPRKTWAQVKRATGVTLDGGVPSHFPNLTEKAVGMMALDGGWLDHLKGIKTINFAHNLADPLDENWVTIDTHMLGIFGYPVGRTITDKMYGEAVESVQYVANKYRLPPSAVQAITWVAYREEKYPGISNTTT